jgi:hypothetical protein
MLPALPVILPASRERTTVVLLQLPQLAVKVTTCRVSAKEVCFVRVQPSVGTGWVNTKLILSSNSRTSGWEYLEHSHSVPIRRSLAILFEIKMCEILTVNHLPEGIASPQDSGQSCQQVPWPLFWLRPSALSPRDRLSFAN